MYTTSSITAAAAHGRAIYISDGFISALEAEEPSYGCIDGDSNTNQHSIALESPSAFSFAKIFRI